MAMALWLRPKSRNIFCASLGGMSEQEPSTSLLTPSGTTDKACLRAAKPAQADAANLASAN
eukprot:904618-Alexandrium_andersonii.AAC.1